MEKPPRSGTHRCTPRGLSSRSDATARPTFLRQVTPYLGHAPLIQCCTTGGSPCRRLCGIDSFTLCKGNAQRATQPLLLLQTRLRRYRSVHLFSTTTHREICVVPQSRNRRTRTFILLFPKQAAYHWPILRSRLFSCAKRTRPSREVRRCPV